MPCVPSPRSSDGADRANVRNDSLYSARLGSHARTSSVKLSPPRRIGLPKQSRAWTLMVVGLPATPSHSCAPLAVHAFAATGPATSSGRNGEPRIGMPLTDTCSFCRGSVDSGT